MTNFYYCPHCGSKIENRQTDNYCTHCGADVADKSAMSVPPTGNVLIRYAPQTTDNGVPFNTAPVISGFVTSAEIKYGPGSIPKGAI